MKSKIISFPEFIASGCAQETTYHLIPSHQFEEELRVEALERLDLRGVSEMSIRASSVAIQTAHRLRSYLPIIADITDTNRESHVVPFSMHIDHLVAVAEVTW